MNILFKKSDGVIIDIFNGKSKPSDDYYVIEIDYLEGVSEELDDRIGAFRIILNTDVPTNVNDMPEILDHIRQKYVKQLSNSVTNYISQYWDIYEQVSIFQFRICGNRMQQNIATGIWDWINDIVLEDYYQRKQIILNSGNTSIIFSQKLDFSMHDDTRPDYTLGMVRVLS